MSKHIELISRGVILDHSNILLCRPKGESYSFLPGGHVEFYENSERALTREIEEELGVRSRVTEYLGTFETAFKSKKKHHEVNIVFKLKSPLKYSKKVKSIEKHIEFFWHPIHKLKDVNFLPKELAILLPSWLDKSTPQWSTTVRN